MLENDTFIILEVLLNDEAMISKNLHKVIDSHCKIAGRDLICKFVNDVTVTKTFCLHFQRQEQPIEMNKQKQLQKIRRNVSPTIRHQTSRSDASS